MIEDTLNAERAQRSDRERQDCSQPIRSDHVPDGSDHLDRARPNASRIAGPTSPAPASTTRHRGRPIILGQVMAVPATTDWRRIATIVGVLAFFGWVLSGFMARSDDTQRIAKRLEEAARDVARQEAKVEVLRTQVAYLATDAYVEVAAREKLGLVKPGDRPVIVLREVDEVAWVPAAPPERPAGPFGPGYGRLDEWVRLFFGGADEGILGKS
jgi:cell division protein FtsB